MRFEIHLCFFCFLSLFLIQSMTENFWITKVAVRKKIGPWNTWKLQTCKIPTTKNFAPTRKILHHEKTTKKFFLNPRNTLHKKCWIHETPTRKNVATNAWWHDYTKPKMARNPHNLSTLLLHLLYKM